MSPHGTMARRYESSSTAPSKHQPPQRPAPCPQPQRRYSLAAGIITSNGYLDDISIYNRALADSEITDLVNDVDKRYEYHHINALGSNIVSTDDNQNVLVRYEYEVFGAIRNQTGTSDNTRKFTGKEFDADSNLYYYGARYYDPYIGRFTQRDPIGDGVNWYAYVANNPLRFVDPHRPSAA